MAITIDEFEETFAEYFQQSLDTQSNFTVSYDKEVSKKFRHKVTYTSTIKTDKFRYYWFTDLGIYKTYNIDSIDKLAEEFVKHYTDLDDKELTFTFTKLD